MERVPGRQPTYWVSFSTISLLLRETTRHGSPKVSDNVTWQQLAKIERMYEVLRRTSEPILHRPNLGLSPSDSDIPSEDTPVTTTEEYDVPDVDWDVHSDASGELQDTELLQPEGDTTSTPVTAGTS